MLTGTSLLLAAAAMRCTRSQIIGPALLAEFEPAYLRLTVWAVLLIITVSLVFLAIQIFERKIRDGVVPSKARGGFIALIVGWGCFAGVTAALIGIFNNDIYAAFFGTPTE